MGCWEAATDATIVTAASDKTTRLICSTSEVCFALPSWRETLANDRCKQPLNFVTQALRMRLTCQANDKLGAFGNDKLGAFGGDEKCGDGFVGTGFGFSL
jgi:hypothetical protein